MAIETIQDGVQDFKGNGTLRTKKSLVMRTFFPHLSSGMKLKQNIILF